MFERNWVRRCMGALLVLLATMAFGAEIKVGMSIGVEGDGFFLNPVVTKIGVTGVEPGSIAAKAGIVTGDEITAVNGKSLKGRRASELKDYMAFGPGESRTLVIRHADGVSFEATLVKPNE